MADYICHARTNYFGVKDPDKFEEEMNQLFEGTVHVHREGDMFALFPEDGFPDFYYLDPDDFAQDEIDWCELMSKHLIDKETVVFMEVGYEKTRYVSGMAWAIHSDGRYCEISLEEIYNAASQAFGCDTPSRCVD